MTLPWLAPESKLGCSSRVRRANGDQLLHRTSVSPFSGSVRQLGYERVLLNMGVLTAAFAVLGLILVGIDRLLGAVELRKAS